MSVALADWIQGIVLCVFIPAFLEGLPARVVEQPLDDPLVMHPILPDIVHSKLLLLLSFIIPVAIFIVLTPRAAVGAFQPFFLGCLEANGLTMTITNILKIVIGRPRPHFAAVCISYAEKSLTVCSGNALAVNEARKSFPSGHSSLAFSTAIYTAAYIASAVSLRNTGPRAADPSPTGWKILAVLACPVAASLVAASRIADYHHNYVDVLAGCLIGASISGLVAFVRLPDVADAAKSVEGSSVLQRASYDALSDLPS